MSPRHINIINTTRYTAATAGVINKISTSKHPPIYSPEGAGAGRGTDRALKVGCASIVRGSSQLRDVTASLCDNKQTNRHYIQTRKAHTRTLNEKKREDATTVYNQKHQKQTTQNNYSTYEIPQHKKLKKRNHLGSQASLRLCRASTRSRPLTPAALPLAAFSWHRSWRTGPAESFRAK